MPSMKQRGAVTLIALICGAAVSRALRRGRARAEPQAPAAEPALEDDTESVVGDAPEVHRGVSPSFSCAIASFHRSEPVHYCRCGGRRCTTANLSVKTVDSIHP